MASEVAVIAGAGAGLSASLARLLTTEGYRVVLAARNTAKLAALVGETGALAVETDVADPASVAGLFDAADKQGPLALAVFNASGRTRGPIAEVDPDAVKQALLVGAYGGFLVGQQAARRLLARGSGSILFTGASASIKGFPNSAGFAMPKFGLRGLAQSMARELFPRNIHVAHHYRRPDRAGRDEARATGQPAVARCDRADLSRDPSPASQRLELRGRAAALCRDILTGPA